MQNGQSGHAVPEGSLRTWIPRIQGHLRSSSCEIVACVLEQGDFHDRNAVAVEKERRIIGHLSQKVSHICALF